LTAIGHLVPALGRRCLTTLKGDVPLPLRLGELAILGDELGLAELCRGITGR